MPRTEPVDDFAPREPRDYHGEIIEQLKRIADAMEEQIRVNAAAVEINNITLANIRATMGGGILPGRIIQRGNQ